MPIPTEPIGSIPRPQALLAGIEAFRAERMSAQDLSAIYNSAVAETIERFEATGSPVITDGEQTKPSFATYPIAGLEQVEPDGVTITFADGHTRQLPRLAAGPFRYRTFAASYLVAAKRYARVPVKQAVISASALSLLYPGTASPGTRGSSSWTTSYGKPASTSAARWTWVPTACRSTSRRGGSPSSSTRPGGFWGRSST